LQAAASHREQHLELLRHQVEELDALAVNSGEIAGLDEEHLRLANSGRLIAGIESALDSLYENEEISAYRIFTRRLTTLNHCAH